MIFRSTTETLVRGALAGLAGTVAMSAVMLAARRTGLMGKMPPERITEAGLRVLHVKTSERAEDTLATVAHLGYGVGMGALFSIVAGTAKVPVPGPVAGGLFGLLLWGVSYAGWIPALGIMPPPHRDQPRRQASMVLAHLAYGSVVGALSQPRNGSGEH
jgi:hypothetical protein